MKAKMADKRIEPVENFLTFLLFAATGVGIYIFEEKYQELDKRVAALKLEKEIQAERAKEGRKRNLWRIEQKEKAKLAREKNEAAQVPVSKPEAIEKSDG